MALAEGAIATQHKMDAAEALLSALAGEEARWNKQLQDFDVEMKCLIGSVPYKPLWNFVLLGLPEVT